MKFLQMIVVFLLPVLSHGQAFDSLRHKTLSPQQMQEDLDAYSQLLQETHPGVFRYLSEEEFRQLVNHIRVQIDKPLSFYAYYHLLTGLSAQVRCAHTQLFPKENVMQYINESCNLFPFFLFPVDDKLYVLFNGTEGREIKPGFELISINGKSVPEIRKIIESHQSLDGNPLSVPRRYLQGGYFSMYHYFDVDQAINFNATFKSLDGRIIEYMAPGQPYKTTDRNYFKNPLNKEMLAAYNKRNKNWDFEILNELPSTALIRFASFGGKGMDTEAKAQEGMQKFMNKAMKKIEQKAITNLIIELRGNTGGWDIQGKELFSYFMKSDTSMLYYRNQYAATKDSEFLKYSDISEADMEKAKAFLIPQEDGSYKLDPAGNSTLLPQEPKSNRFNGNLYILFDEQCSSSCAEFVAVAKSNKIGILVGTEAGGAYEGGNGGSFINFKLPNSGIFSNSPLVKYEMAVNPAKERGRGTLPDHNVEMTLEDILAGRDPQREFVYQLIRDDKVLKTH